MPLPSFVVVGAQKAGTTTLHRVLRRHRQIHLPATKELHFFDQHFDRGLDWYSSQFRPRFWQRAVGEATPVYAYRKEVRQRLIKSLPDARIVMLLRNPVDRAYSHYWHDLRRQELARHDRGVHATFEEAIANERPYIFAHLIGGDAPRMFKENWGKRLAYVRRGEYMDQIEPFLEAYGRERLHIMLLDDFAADRESSLRDLFGFLGVWRGAARRIPSDVHANRYRRPDVEGRMQVSAYVPMSEETRAAMVEHYRPYNERLAALLGRDLSGWG